MTTASPAAVRDMTSKEFAGFQKLVADGSGIVLTAAKRQLLVGRIARVVRERGLGTYGAYLEAIQADRSGNELVRLLDLVSTNETRFFRERGHYRYLTETCYPAWRAAAANGLRGKSIRAWSAACSTGQEPYSVMMTLLENFPAAEGWSHEMLASDISTRALAAAAAGEYAIDDAPAIPVEYRRRFLWRGVGDAEGRMRVSADLRAPIRFKRVNLMTEPADIPGLFDLVFCSNALIYFSRTDRAQVLARLASKLAPGGRLFVGHAESLHEHRDILRSVAPTVYAHANDHTHEIRS